jgi:hypothetical protein
MLHAVGDIFSSREELLACLPTSFTHTGTPPILREFQDSVQLNTTVASQQ